MSTLCAVTCCHVVMCLDPGVPTSVDFVRCEPNQMVVTYSSSNAYVFDTEKGKPVTVLESKQASG